MSTRLNLSLIEQPIALNEKYIAYMLPATDIDYLNRHTKNPTNAPFSTYMGLFEPAEKYYHKSLVIVRITSTPVKTELTPAEADEYNMFANMTDTRSTIWSSDLSALRINRMNGAYIDNSNIDQLNMITYNYCVVEFYENNDTPLASYMHDNPVINKYGPNSFEANADIFIKSVSRYMQRHEMLGNFVSSKQYKPYFLNNYSYNHTDKTLWNEVGRHRGCEKIKMEVIAGLYKYLSGDYAENIAINPIKKVVPATEEERRNMVFEHLVFRDSENEDDPYLSINSIMSTPKFAVFSKVPNDKNSYKIIFKSVPTLTYNHISFIRNEHVIGTRINPSPSVYNDSLWYLGFKNGSGKRIEMSCYNILLLQSYLELCNINNIFKLCLAFKFTEQNTVLTVHHTVYIKKDFIDRFLTVDPASGNIKVSNATTFNKLLKIDTTTCFSYHGQIDINQRDALSGPIFRKSASGTYNPVLDGIDVGLSVEEQANITSVLDRRINTICPTFQQIIQIRPFNYQKRNIIWMQLIENQVKSGNHKLKIEYGALYNKIDMQRAYNSSSVVITNYTFGGNSYGNIEYDGSRNYGHNHEIVNTYIKDIDKTQDLVLDLTGGLLCDDVGLGKTFSTICHIVNQKPHDMSNAANWELNNCILVPSRLLQQWKFEIEKYTAPGTLTITTLGSITDIKKLYKKRDDGSLYMHTKYDVYIISINLLGNKNYFTYLEDNFSKENVLSGSERGYFDIYRIKWNRLICDEAHERIMSTVDWGNTGNKSRDDYTMSRNDRIITNNIVFNIQANYRWGLTATPFEQPTNNALGYLAWLSKNIKNNTLDVDVAKTLYVKDMATVGMSYDSLKIYKDTFCHLPKFITPKQLEKFQMNCFTKTTKTFVSGEIKIPIFTEEVKYIELSQIERNIYNNARADNSNVRHTVHIDRIKRLFQLCTNINISDVDIENMGINVAEGSHLTLEQLNSSMVKLFQKQLKEVQSELSREKADGPDNAAKKVLAKRIKEYMEQNVDPSLPTTMAGPAGQRIRYFIESCNTSNGYYNGVYSTDTDRVVMKNMRKELYARLLECNDSMDNVFVLVSELMSKSPNGQRPDWNDAKVMQITYYLINSFYTKASNSSKDTEETIAKLEREALRLENQIKLFESNDFIKEKTNDPCIICWADYDDSSSIAVTDCRHIFCGGCFESMGRNKATFPCPECRGNVDCKKTKITTMAQIKAADKPPEPDPAPVADPATANPAEDWKTGCLSKYGTKMTVLIEYLRTIIAEEGKTNRAIIFSQYDNMLKLIGKTLTEYKISNVYCKGNVHVINKNIDKFKRDNTIRVIMLSSENSNSGSNLTEASHIILVDVLNMDAGQTKDVESQAIGRAVRLGQQKPVKVVRLITKNTVEDEYYSRNKYDIATIQ